MEEPDPTQSVTTEGAGRPLLWHHETWFIVEPVLGSILLIVLLSLAFFLGFLVGRSRRPSNP
jgi:hypothetical protein